MAYPAPILMMIMETETAGRKSGLSQAKQALLEKCLRGEARPAAPAAPIFRRGKGPAAPLSFAQERIWFFSQLAPESPLYNLPVALRVKGRLRAPALKAAVEAIVARHEILRTHFVAEEGNPSQTVEPAARNHLSIVDLSREREPGREARLQNLIRNECCRPFDLSRDPMLRGLLIRLGDSDHVLVLVAHHIAIDAWSWGIFFRELAGFYEGFASGRPAALPAMAIQYADFAVWQKERLRGEVLAAQLAYWKRKLAGSPMLLELATDRPRAARQTFCGGSARRQLPRGMGDALRELGRREGATLFMTLMAAFNVFLHRQTGAVDIVVGTPVAGRTHLETEGLIGFFVNTLPVRSDLSGDPAFGSFLRQVRESILAAFSHQDLPFERLVEEMRLRRSPRHAPLFNVMFVFQDSRHGISSPAGLTFAPMEVETGTAKFDLTLYMDETEGLSAGLEFNSDLFAPATVERMLANWQSLLEEIIADPARRISDLTAEGDVGREIHGERRPGIGGCQVDPDETGAILAEQGGADQLDEREKRLEAIWKSVLGIAAVGATDNFFEIGGHSLLAVRLVAQIEKAFGRKLPVSAVYQAPSIRQLARLLDPRGAGAIEDSPLVGIRPHGGRPPLCLVHGIAGGMLWGYANLARHLSPDQPVFAFKSRGSDGLDEFGSIEEMASHYLKALRRFQPCGPYRLGGYCFGGNVAFEMARQLREQGQEVALLALFNSLPPKCSLSQCSRTPAQTAKFLFRLLLWMADFRKWDPALRRQFIRWKIRTLVRKMAAWRRLRTRGGGDPDPDTLVDFRSFPEDQREVLAAHVRALCRYESRPYEGQVTLFRTRGYPLNGSFDTSYGWGEFARGGVVVRMIPGTHESILDEPQVAWVARAVDDCLKDAGVNGRDTP